MSASSDIPLQEDCHATSPTKKKKGDKSVRKEDTLPLTLNAALHCEDFKRLARDAYTQHDTFKHENGSEFYHEPFKCFVLPSVVQGPSNFLERLQTELLDQIFYDKNNDLYKFQQTDDLKKVSTLHVKSLRRLLCEDLRHWISDVTGIELTDRVDLTCSRYDYTDTLLCHDDELDTRRIAFVLYLVPPWSTEDGGALDLMDMDRYGQPGSVAKSIFPKWNSLVWFEVTEASHHQVAEVTNPDKTRLSVNGWFHGALVPRPERHLEPPRTLCPHVSIEEEMVYEWINPMYLGADIQAQIQEKFEQDSEIELQGFLKEEKYQAIAEVLEDPDLQWQLRGPPNKRNYYHLAEENLPSVLRECTTFMRSEAVFLILSNLTGLCLHELAVRDDASISDADSEELDMSKEKDMDPVHGEGDPEGDVEPQSKKLRLGEENAAASQAASETGTGTKKSAGNPRCRCEVRRWNHGCYTLVHDTDTESAQFALDAVLFCAHDGWKHDCGGYTSYITKGEDEELLTVSPAKNSLALVYRDKETLKFVKHINDKAKHDSRTSSGFYDISLEYYE